MTGNHLMLLFRSVLIVRRSSRSRVQQSSFIGHSVNVWLYRLSFFVGRIGVCPIPAHNEGVASKCSSKFYYVCILLDPVINVHQRRSTFWFGALHESRNVYPATIWLHLKLEVRPIWTRYGTSLIAAFRVSVEYILSWKENPASNWSCLNKTFLSSFTELCNLCKCLCHN